MEPENLQNVLQEAGIQVDMKTLQNPTEEFLKYLIIEYFNKFHFDGNEIAKSTPEQLECVSCPDSAYETIKAINLYTALSSICDEIFIKDLCLTDITSPGPKRTRRQIKILFNYFAYVRNKMVEHELAFIDLEKQQKKIEELNDEKNAIIARTGATIREREDKLELKQKLLEEIENIRSDLEMDSKRSNELEIKVKDVMVKHQEAYKKCSDLKAKAMQMRKENTDLQSKIVKSPEGYAAKTKELKKVLEIRKEERQVLNDSITRKKIQIKNNENAQELIKDLNEKFAFNMNETFKKLKETTEKLESAQKELNSLKNEIANCLHMESDTSITFSAEDIKGHEQLLFELDNQRIDKERELSTLRNQLEELKFELSKKKATLDNELKTIVVVEEENSSLIKQCQEHFLNEISEEINLREAITIKFKTDNRYKEL